MARDGVEASVLFPPIFGMRTPDRALADAVVCAYNDWAIDFGRAAPNQLLAVAQLFPDDPEASTREVCRAASLGFKQVHFLVGTVTPAMYQPAWDRFWDAAEDAGMIVSYHTGGVSATGAFSPVRLLTVYNHNLVNGVREFARAKATPVTYVPVVAPDLGVKLPSLKQQLKRIAPGCNSLFAYPAQSNLSGVQHPLRWIALAKEQGWDVLLDAAAFVPTNRLDIDRWQPDFVAVSFYKTFRYPTGIGCLIARRSAVARLRRAWVAGDAIDIASVSVDAHEFNPDEAGFDDGTKTSWGCRR